MYMGVGSNPTSDTKFFFFPSSQFFLAFLIISIPSYIFFSVPNYQYSVLHSIANGAQTPLLSTQIWNALDDRCHNFVSRHIS